MRNFNSLFLMLFLAGVPALAADIGLFQNLNGAMPVITLALNPATAQEIDLTAAGDGTSGPSGTYNAAGAATGTYTNGDSSYFAGSISGLEFRNYFAFDESGLTPGLAVRSATITLSEPAGGFIGTDTLNYTLYSLGFAAYGISDLVAGNGGTDAFNDLGDGTAYGSAMVPAGSSPVVLTLNAAAISLIEAEEGQGFVPFGGAVTDTAAASTPEPSTMLLFGGAGLAMCLFRRRRFRPALWQRAIGSLLIGTVTVASAQTICSNGQTICLSTNGYNVATAPVVASGFPPPSCTTLAGNSLVYDPDTGACVTIAGPVATQFCVQSPLDLIFPNQVTYSNGVPQPNGNLEQVAVDGISAYLVSQNIPNYTGAGCYNNGITRLRLSQPDEAAAAAYLEFMAVIAKTPSQRTAYEQAAFDWLSAELKAYRVNAALAAQAEYVKWKANACSYTAPAGFPYSPPTAYCTSQSGLATVLATPDTVATPPDFIGIGTFRAFPSLSTGPGNLKSSDIATQVTAIASNAGSAFVSAGAVSLLQRLPPSLAYQLVTAIYPNVLKPQARAAAAVAIEAGESVADIFDIAGRFAGPIGLIIASIQDIVFATINIVADVNRGKDLQNGVNNAQTATINLNNEITTSDGLQQLMAIFADQVNLTPSDAQINPAAVYANFTETDSNFNQISTSAFPLVYRTWDQSVWSSNFIWTSGWWEHAPLGTMTVHTGGYINYLDWEGRQLTATFSPANGVFLVTGYPAGASVLTDALYVVDQNNVKRRYVLNNSASGAVGGLWIGGGGTALTITTLAGGYLETSTMFRNQSPNGASYQEFIGANASQIVFASCLVGSNTWTGGTSSGVLVWGADNNQYVENVNPASLVVNYNAVFGGGAFTRPYFTFRDATSGANLIGTFTPFTP